jgi:ubiquinone/menaquinone biosynthesis C-methylase UbiE
MQPAGSEFDQIKQNLRGMWMAGDFGQIAQYSTKTAEAFVGRLNLQSGMRVLDVACGTGNLAIPAARKGARVTGLDLAPNLLAQARARAAAEGLDATFDEGDAEQLPYSDGAFDVVMSMFGAMFAPRPDRCAAELARVCRPGGIIAMANWTPGGLAGKMFALGARHAPPPPGIPAPVEWGDEQIVRQRLGPFCSAIQTNRQIADIDFPFPPRKTIEFFIQYFGPTKVAFSRLPPEGQAAYAADMEKLWSESNQGDSNRTQVPAEYLEIIATRA